MRGRGLEGGEHRHQVGQPAPQQRLAAGQPDVGDAEPDGDADQPGHLLEGQQLGLGQPVQPLGRHAVAAPQVAPVGHRDPQVGRHPSVPVGQHAGRHPPGAGWASWTVTSPAYGAGPPVTAVWRESGAAGAGGLARHRRRVRHRLRLPRPLAVPPVPGRSTPRTTWSGATTARRRSPLDRCCRRRRRRWRPRTRGARSRVSGSYDAGRPGARAQPAVRRGLRLRGAGAAGPGRRAGRPCWSTAGWMPNGQTSDAPDSVPAPPTGPVTVTAHLLPSEPAKSGTLPAGQFASIDLARIAQATGQPLLPAYGVLAAESPAPATAPSRLPEPDDGGYWGVNLSYAFQWGLFAIAGLAFPFVFLRRRRRLRAEDEAAAEAAGRAGPTTAEPDDAVPAGRKTPPADLGRRGRVAGPSPARPGRGPRARGLGLGDAARAGPGWRTGSCRGRRRGRRAASSSSWRPRLDDPAVVDHGDQVGAPHRREPVRDDQRGAARPGPCRGPAARRPRTRCPGGPSPRRGRPAPGDLSSSRAMAIRCFSPPDSRWPRSPTTVSRPCGQRRSPGPRSGPTRSTPLQVGLGRVRPGVGQVGPDRVVEHVGVLGHDADGVAQRVQA